MPDLITVLNAFLWERLNDLGAKLALD